MYIGDTSPSLQPTWVYDVTTKKMVSRELRFVPALVKLFDEILVNAADNRYRQQHGNGNSKAMSYIAITIGCSEANQLSISVKNDGYCVPIVKSSSHGSDKDSVFIPEMIFGELMTGSNFNDDTRSIVGGRHGLGAKLTNIFSSRFDIEICDATATATAGGTNNKQVYRQGWSNSMCDRTDPVIEAVPVTSSKGKSGGGNSSSGSYTQVSFTPNLRLLNTAPFRLFPREGSELGVTAVATTDVADAEPALIGSGGRDCDSDRDKGLAAVEDVLQLLHRRACDVAACVGPAIRVTVNGTATPCSSFPEYASLFRGDTGGGGSSTGVAHLKVNDRWEVAVLHSPSGNFEHLSFVNSVWTMAGGSHVEYITKQLTNYIVKELRKSNTSSAWRPNAAMIRNQLMVFVKCEVENPSFSSQNKDTLTSRVSDFGSTCELPESFLKSALITKTGIVDYFLNEIAMKETFAMKKKSLVVAPVKRTVSVPKLEDAHNAGSAKSSDCTLILTEGDSAKALAVCGLEVIGRENFGVFPLKGKILNVSDRSTSISNKSAVAASAAGEAGAMSAELLNLCTSLGLSFDCTYEDPAQRACVL